MRSADAEELLDAEELFLHAVGSTPRRPTWGVGFFVVGLVFFWQAENKYGRG
jgi:hypothetical protein